MRTGQRTNGRSGRWLAVLTAAGIAGCAAGEDAADPAGLEDGPAHYVAPTGDDGADGSFESPWQDLAAAVDRLEAGDTLFVREGDYYGGIEVGVSGEPGLPVTIAGYSGEGPRIHAEQPYGFLLGCGIHDVVIRGFEIDDFSVDYGGGHEAHGMAHAAGIMGRCDEPPYLAVSDSAFLDNVIHGTRLGGQEGIWLRGSPGSVVAGNVIRDLGSSAIRIKHSEGCTVFSNLAYDVGFVDNLGAAFTYYCSSDSEFSFNTAVMIDATESPAILIPDRTNSELCDVSESGKVHDNIGVHLGLHTEVLAHALCVQGAETSAPGLEFHDNLWWTAGDWTNGRSLERCPPVPGGEVPVVLWGSDLVYQGGCWLTVSSYQELTGHGAGSLQEDPVFADVAARDFRLGPDSPASDRAVASEVETELLEVLGLEVPPSGRMDLGFQFPEEG